MGTIERKMNGRLLKERKAKGAEPTGSARHREGERTPDGLKEMSGVWGGNEQWPKFSWLGELRHFL